MRVGLVLQHFDPRRGGLEQWSVRFAERLAARGHEVHVVARRFDGGGKSAPVVPHRIDGAETPLKFAEEAQAKLSSLALDVIHDMGAGWHCDVFHPHGGSWHSITERKLSLMRPGLRELKRGLNVLLPRHRRYRALMARQYADHGQIMLALSRSVAEDFRRFHQVPAERIRVVYNGVDVERFSPEQRGRFRASLRRSLGIDDDTVLALIVAHNFRLKGVPTLLRAMQRFHREPRPVRLVVVGGKRLLRWQLKAARLGVARLVDFVGPVDDPVPYYAAADLYVHPTTYDTCSLVVLEAAASGLPVVTSRLNGVAELLKHGTDALLLRDPTNVDELTGAMQTLFDDSRRAELGSAARRTALKHPLDRNVDEVLAVYEELLASRGRKRRARSVQATRRSRRQAVRGQRLAEADSEAARGRSVLA